MHGDCRSHTYNKINVDFACMHTLCRIYITGTEFSLSHVTRHLMYACTNLHLHTF